MPSRSCTRPSSGSWSSSRVSSAGRLLPKSRPYAPVSSLLSQISRIWGGGEVGGEQGRWVRGLVGRGGARGGRGGRELVGGGGGRGGGQARGVEGGVWECRKTLNSYHSGVNNTENPR